MIESVLVREKIQKYVDTRKSNNYGDFAVLAAINITNYSLEHDINQKININSENYHGEFLAFLAQFLPNKIEIRLTYQNHTNWEFMRFLSSNAPEKYYLEILKKRQNKDGFIKDQSWDNSFPYHIFNTLLLLFTKHNKLNRYIEKAIYCIENNLQYLHRGRGAGQTFPLYNLFYITSFLQSKDQLSKFPNLEIYHLWFEKNFIKWDKLTIDKIWETTFCYGYSNPYDYEGWGIFILSLIQTKYFENKRLFLNSKNQKKDSRFSISFLRYSYNIDILKFKIDSSYIVTCFGDHYPLNENSHLGRPFFRNKVINRISSRFILELKFNNSYLFINPFYFAFSRDKYFIIISLWKFNLKVMRSDKRSFDLGEIVSNSSVTEYFNKWIIRI